MKTISLKIDDTVFSETEKILDRVKKPRNRYINEALKHYNKIQRRALLEETLKNESALVAIESKRVLAEFEAVDEAD